MCHILISCTIVARRIAHKVQLHLDWYVWMNMYINTVYTCCIGSVTCNWMSCATCLRQLHKFAVACVACNWILVAKPKIYNNDSLWIFWIQSDFFLHGLLILNPWWFLTSNMCSCCVFKWNQIIRWPCYWICVWESSNSLGLEH